MYCVNCGKEMPEYAVFCPMCGKAAEKPAPPGYAEPYLNMTSERADAFTGRPAAENTSPGPMNPPAAGTRSGGGAPEPRARASRKLKILIGVSAGIFLLCASFAGAYLSKVLDGSLEREREIARYMAAEDERGSGDVEDADKDAEGTGKEKNTDKDTGETGKGNTGGSAGRGTAAAANDTEAGGPDGVGGNPADTRSDAAAENLPADAGPDTDADSRAGARAETGAYNYNRADAADTTAEPAAAEYGPDGGAAAAAASVPPSDAAAQYLDAEIANMERQRDEAFRAAVSDLEALSGIGIFLDCQLPVSSGDGGVITIDDVADYITDSFLDGITGGAYGELQNAQSYAGMVGTIADIFLGENSPVYAIYTIQTFSRASMAALTDMLAAGVTEDNFYEAYHLAESVYKYQCGINVNQLTLDIDYGVVLYEYLVILNSAARNSNLWQESKARLELLSIAKQHMPAGQVDGGAAILEFAEAFDAFCGQYEQKRWDAVPAGSSLHPVYVNFSTQPDDRYIDLIPLEMSYNTVLIRYVEGADALKSTLIDSLISSTVWYFDPAVEEMSQKKRANTAAAVTLPNVFYQEYSVKQRNKLCAAYTFAGAGRAFCAELLENARAEDGGGLYAVILRALTDADFVGGNMGAQMEDLAVEMTKSIYVDYMAAELYDMTLDDPLYGYNLGLAGSYKIRLGTAGLMSCLVNAGLMTSDSFAGIPSEPQKHYFTFSSDIRYSGDPAKNEECTAYMNQARRHYVDVLTRVTDLLMFNDSTDGFHTGGSDIGYLTPLGQNGNRLYYDKKELADGGTRVVKAVEMKSSDSRLNEAIEIRRACYYDSKGLPVYVLDTVSGRGIYAMETLIGFQITEKGGLAFSANYELFDGDTDGAAVNMMNAWREVYPDIGVSDDGAVTQRLEQLMAGN